MKILTLADQESRSLWDYFEKAKLEGVDLIISCGDLAPQYLSFLATFTHAPVSMSMETTMTAMNRRPRKAASV